jgi:hypothetical protein
METSPEQIKDLAVEIVKGFIDNKTPLNEGIAKCASEMELNPEQIKRVVETCNTVTYLTLQKEASDKTIEFPVADYTGVIGKMVVPTEGEGGYGGQVTAAEFKESMQKEAEVQETEPSVDLETARVLAMKEYRANRTILTKLAHDKAECLTDIGNLTAKIKKDGWAMEKLAEVTDEETFKRVGHLIGDTGKELRSFIFKQAELSEVAKLVELFKKANELVAESKKREELDKRAVLQAVSGALGGAIGRTVGSVAALGAVGAKNSIKGLGKSKYVHPLDIAGAALTQPTAERNIWDNLQGSRKRF